METELKVKLEDIVLLAESITKLTPEVYGLHKKIVDEEEIKTPTKEQIDFVANKIALYKHMPHPRVVAKIAITEWEKIRGE